MKIAPCFPVAACIACVCALLFSLLPSSPARAGVDAFRVVVSLSGKAWVRGFDRTKHGLRFEPWKPLRVGEQIGPNHEVRVDAGGTLRLQKGDERRDPAKLPTDVKVYYDVLHGGSAGSAMRLNRQQWAIDHHTVINQTLRGKITGETVAGRIPPKDYYAILRREARVTTKKSPAE